MRKKGFTLIELLAVIIILAIIALIATPIVMRVVGNSRKGAAERSAENYISAVQTQMAALRTEGTVLEGTYGIKANGNLCLDKTTTCNEAGEIKIEITGTKPSGGSIVISDGKVQATGTSIMVEEYTVTINESGNAAAVKRTENAAIFTEENQYGTYTFDGTENWQFNGNNEPNEHGIYNCYLLGKIPQVIYAEAEVQGYYLTEASVNNTYFNRLVSETRNTSEEPGFNLFVNDPSFFFRFDDTIATSPEDFKTYLSNNPITVTYKLK